MQSPGDRFGTYEVVSALGAWVRCAAFACITLACLPSVVRAATIRGTVIDPSRAAIAGASVTVRNEDTGSTRSSTTNADGLFAVTDLAVGRYAIEVASAGFKTATVRGVRLEVADVRAVEVELAIGAVREQVEVDASALQVKTIGGEVAGLVTGEQVRELPLNGRNYLQLALLMPGVSPGDGLNLTDKALLSLGALVGERRRAQPRTCSRWTASTTTTSAPTSRASSHRPSTRSRSSRSTATATGPSTARPREPRSTS